MADVIIKDGRVALINPQSSQLEWIPSDQAPRLMGQGWMPETYERYREGVLEESHGGVGGALKSAGIGAARGATFGLSDLFFSDKDLARYQEANPWSSGLGEAGGMIGSAIATGGTSLIARGAAKVAPMALTAKAGRAVGGQVAKRLGGGKAAQAAGRVAGGATEGAVVAGAMGLTEPLRDPDAEMADAFGRLAEGAGWGAGAEVAFMGLGTAGKFIGRHYRKAMEKGGARLDDIADSEGSLRKLTKEIEAIQAKSNATSMDLPSAGGMAPGIVAGGGPLAGAPSLGPGRNLAAVEQMAQRSLASTPERMAERAAQQRRMRYAGEDPVASMLPVSPGKPVKAPALEPPAEGLFPRAAPGTKKWPSKYSDQPVSPWDKELAGLEKQRGKVEMRLRELRQLDDAEVKASQKAMNKADKERMKSLDSRIKGVRGVAERTAYWSAFRSFRSGMGGGASNLAAGGMGVMGGGMLAGVLGYFAAPIVIKAAHHVLWNAGKGIAKMQGAGPTVQRILGAAKTGARARVTMTPGEYNDMKEEMAATSPDQINDRAQMMMPAWLAPEAGQQLTAQTIKAVAYLNGKMPKGPKAVRDWVPDQNALDKFARRVRATVDAESPIRDFARGQLTREAKETFATLYPQEYQSFSDWVISQIIARQNIGETVPSEMLSQAALLTGREELAPAIEHRAVQAYLQQSYSAAMEDRNPRPPSGGGSPEIGDRNMSRMDRAIERTG